MGQIAKTSAESSLLEKTARVKRNETRGNIPITRNLEELKKNIEPGDILVTKKTGKPDALARLTTLRQRAAGHSKGMSTWSHAAIASSPQTMIHAYDKITDKGLLNPEEAQVFEVPIDKFEELGRDIMVLRPKTTDAQKRRALVRARKLLGADYDDKHLLRATFAPGKRKGSIPSVPPKGVICTGVPGNAYPTLKLHPKKSVMFMLPSDIAASEALSPIMAYSGKTKKAAEEDSNAAALAKARRIRRELQKKYNVRPYLAGSLALGTNLPGESDYDFGIAVQRKSKFLQLADEFSKDMTPSPYNKGNSDYRVFQTEVDGEPVDVALVYGGKGIHHRDAISHWSKKLTPAQKQKIIDEKKRLKNVWILPKVRYKRYKRQVDTKLGIPRFARWDIDDGVKEKAAEVDPRWQLLRSDVFGHRTPNLVPIIESGKLLSSVEAAKAGKLKSFEFKGSSRSRKELEVGKPEQLRAEVFVTQGLMPTDATYGQYGILLRSRKATPSRYLNTIPGEHVVMKQMKGKMTFVVPDKELTDWEKKYPKERFIRESEVPESKRLESASYLSEIPKRIFRIPKLIHETEEFIPKAAQEKVAFNIHDARKILRLAKAKTIKPDLTRSEFLVAPGAVTKGGVKLIKQLSVNHPNMADAFRPLLRTAENLKGKILMPRKGDNLSALRRYAEENLPAAEAEVFKRVGRDPEQRMMFNAVIARHEMAELARGAKSMDKSLSHHAGVLQQESNVVASLPEKFEPVREAFKTLRSGPEGEFWNMIVGASKVGPVGYGSKRLSRHTKSRMVKGEQGILEKISALKQKVRLRPHQKAAIERIEAAGGRGLLAHGTGTGKTLSSIAAVEKMREEGKANRTLVLTPASLQTNFAEQGVKKFTDSTVGEVGSDADYQLMSLEKFRKNPDKYLEQSGADTMIVDEMHRAKDPKSKTYKALKRASDKVDNFVGLTGSFISNHPREVVPLMNIAHPEHRLGTQAGFSRAYVHKVDERKGWLFGPVYKQTKLKNKPRLGKNLKAIHYVGHEDLAAEMPRMEIERVKVPMTSEQKKLYEFSLGRLTKSEREKIRQGLPVSQSEAQHIFAQLMKARQASNAIGTHKEMKPERSAENTPKLRRVMDDVEEHIEDNKDARPIVYTNFVRGGADELAAGFKARGLKPGLYSGTNKKERDKELSEFKKGNRDVMILTPAGGEGVSIDNATFFGEVDRHYNPEKNQQAIARGRRLGGLRHRAPKDRVLLVKRYYSDPRTSFFDRLIGKKEYGIDEWIGNVAAEKDRLNEEMRGVAMKLKAASEVSKDPELIKEARTAAIKFLYKLISKGTPEALEQASKLVGRTSSAGRTLSLKGTAVERLQRIRAAGKTVSKANLETMAKTRGGMVGPGRGGRTLARLDRGGEGIADLVVHPEHGMSVRKLYDPRGLGSREVIKRKAQLAKSVKGTPEEKLFAKMHESTVAPGGGDVQFSEFLPGAVTKSRRGVTAEQIAKVRKGGRKHGYELRDVRPSNVDPVTGKALDYIPAKPGEFIDPSTVGRGENVLLGTPTGEKLLKGGRSSKFTEKATSEKGMAQLLGRGSRQAKKVRGGIPRAQSSIQHGPVMPTTEGTARVAPKFSKAPTDPLQGRAGMPASPKFQKPTEVVPSGYMTGPAPGTAAGTPGRARAAGSSGMTPPVPPYKGTSAAGPMKPQTAATAATVPPMSAGNTRGVFAATPPAPIPPPPPAAAGATSAMRAPKPKAPGTVSMKAAKIPKAPKTVAPKPPQIPAG